MALDKALRDGLRSRVQSMRDTLTHDLARILEATFGVHADGHRDPVTKDDLPELFADARVRETRELLERVLPAPPASAQESKKFEDSFDELVRQLAFTHLNRLVAFKAMEHRKIIQETVGRGLESRGFKHYVARVEGRDLLPSSEADAAYRRYILWLCAELDREIGHLFDPEDLASRVQPSHRALHAVLGEINADDLAPAWEHEETLGWVYQFYTPRRCVARRGRRAQPRATHGRWHSGISSTRPTTSSGSWPTTPWDGSGSR